MADKIVTLKDKNNNNLYPAAGAVFADAVSTDSIQDGAVTSDKIDFPSLVASDIYFVGKDNITVPASWQQLTIDTKTVTLPSPGKYILIGGTTFTDFANSSEFRLAVRANGSNITHQTLYVSRPLQGLTNTVIFDTPSATIELVRIYNGDIPSGGKIRIGDSKLVCIKIG